MFKYMTLFVLLLFSVARSMSVTRAVIGPFHDFHAPGHANDGHHDLNNGEGAFVIHSDPLVGHDLATYRITVSSTLDKPTRRPLHIQTNNQNVDRKLPIQTAHFRQIHNRHHAAEQTSQTTHTFAQTTYSTMSVHDRNRPLSSPVNANLKESATKILPQVKFGKTNHHPLRERSTYDSLPNEFKSGLLQLLQKVSTHVAGRQILEKLNIVDCHTAAVTDQGQLQLNLTPEKTDRLLRVLSGLKTSTSGKDLLHQMGLTQFMGLPEPPTRQSSGGNGVLNSDVPHDLDFSSYDYDGEERCVDDLIKYSMDRYRGRRRGFYTRAPGYIVTEMDMVLTADQWRFFYGNLPLPPGRGKRSVDSAPRLERMKRKAIKKPRYYWPGNSIPYELDENDFSWSDVMLFERAMYEWEQSTCIRFRMATSSDVNRIRFRDGPGCSSHVGMIGGVQNITLQGPCRIRRIVLHEIGHALGLVHEHQRPDRDAFIRILYENARPGTEWDFKKRTWSSVVNHTVSYDYRSVMHYGPNAFSMDRRRPTILARDSNYQDVIGKVTQLSFDDKKIVNMMYKCNSHCSKDIICQYGGYVGKDCSCVCPGRRNCRLIKQVKPVQTAPRVFNWIKLFQSFSWNALRQLGLLRTTGQTARPALNRKPIVADQEQLDSVIPRHRHRSTVHRTNVNRTHQRTHIPSRTRSSHHTAPYTVIHHSNTRLKRDIKEQNTRRWRRSLILRASRPRSRVRTRRPMNRRYPWFGRRRSRDRSRRNKLPRLSRKYFRSISNSDREARMKEIRYNNRRKRFNKTQSRW